MQITHCSGRIGLKMRMHATSSWPRDSLPLVLIYVIYNIFNNLHLFQTSSFIAPTTSSLCYVRLYTFCSTWLNKNVIDKFINLQYVIFTPWLALFLHGFHLDPQVHDLTQKIPAGLQGYFPHRWQVHLYVLNTESPGSFKMKFNEDHSFQWCYLVTVCFGRR